MKTINKKNGFALPSVLLILSLLGLSITFFVYYSQYSFEDLQKKRLLSSRDDMVAKITNVSSLGSALRHSVSFNPQLAACVTSGTCTAGGPFPLNLASPVYSSPQTLLGGVGPDGVTYDIWENPCPAATPTSAPLPPANVTCPLSVITEFSIICPGGAPTCASGQASIAVGYTVKKAANTNYPGSLNPVSSPTPVPVPVPCITFVGPTTVSGGGPTCY